MSKNLSQMIADLFSKPTEGMDLSSQTQNLGEELRKVIHSEDAVFGTLSGLLESFRTIIPDENQRYRAALQALSTTSKLSRQEILRAMSGQLEELKRVQSGLAPASQAWRAELLTMEARSQGLKGEIANLRARMAQLEGEEKSVQAAAARRQLDLDHAEKSIHDIFEDIGAEILSLSRKVGALPAEAPVAQPGPPLPAPPAAQPVPEKDAAKGAVPSKKKDGEQKVEIKRADPQQDTKFRRKCPMCGGPFHLLELEDIWQCFTCAHEEQATGAVQGESEEKSEPMDAPASAEDIWPTTEAASSPIEPASMVNGPAGPKKGSSRSGSQTGARKKSCPVCFKKMIWYPGEKVWRCPAGHHERK